MYNKTRLLILFLLISLNSFCQQRDIFEPDSVRKEIEAVEIHSSLRIDGLLNEAEWKLAKPSPRFVEIEPVQGNPPGEATEVKVLYNRQYLYFGIFAHDSLGKKALRATDFKRDFDDKSRDLVGIAFDCFNDKRNAMSFVTDPYGVQRDLLSFDDLYYDADWNGLWRVRTSRTDSGWTAEIAIPWETLRYPNSDSLQQWGLSIYRNRRITNEITSFSPYPRAFTSLRMSYAGVLTNLKPPPPATNIRFEPYALSSYDHYSGFDSTVKKNETNYKFGGDLKWAIDPNSVLDLTVNTDFAQADADQQVNNVTRFSVFFPEKRQFFLENASLFGVGISQAVDGSGGQMRVQPFFSRTIGLDSLGNPIPIEAGGRFVHRSTKTNYGAILMRQRASDNSPVTNFFVGRYSENIGTNSRLGGLVTVKNQPGNTNIVSTIDGFFRLGESHSLNTMLIHSANTQKKGRNGFAGFAQYYYSTNHMKIWLTQSVVTKDFDPQMGFVSRTDVIGTTPGMNWYYRGKILPFKKILRAFEPGFLPEFYWQASTGQSIERTFTLFPVWFNFQSGAYFGYGFTPSFQRLTVPFEPLGVSIAPGEYYFTNQQIWVSSDPSRIISINGIYSWGNYFNGKLNSGDWNLQLAPIPQISLTGRFNRNRFIKVGTPATYTTIDLYGLQARLALNPRLQLIGFYQKNASDNSENYNLRLSWEYRPLSYVYLVLNHYGFTTLQQKIQMEDHAIAKISFLKQL